MAFVKLIWENILQDFVLPTECVNFCQPDGCKVIQMKKGRNKEINSFAFILTDKDSGKYFSKHFGQGYGTNLSLIIPLPNSN